MKTYTFKVVIAEGNDEFWEDITANGKTGCDELYNLLKDCITNTNIQDFEVAIIKYEDK